MSEELLPCKNCNAFPSAFHSDRGDVTCPTGHCTYEDLWVTPEDWNLIMAGPRAPILTPAQAEAVKNSIQQLDDDGMHDQAEELRAAFPSLFEDKGREGA